MSVFVVAAVMASGCATMVASGPVHVPVSSSPAGAQVFVNDEPVGQTPMMVELASKLPKAELRLELPGFQTVVIQRDKKLNGWVWGNLLIGGLIGIAIDVASGAIQHYDDKPVAVVLQPGAGQQVESSAPPLISDADCKEQRHRIFAEAMDIQNGELRLQKLRTAPVCK